MNVIFEKQYMNAILRNNKRRGKKNLQGLEVYQNSTSKFMNHSVTFRSYAYGWILFHPLDNTESETSGNLT